MRAIIIVLAAGSIALGIWRLLQLGERSELVRSMQSFSAVHEVYVERAVESRQLQMQTENLTNELRTIRQTPFAIRRDNLEVQPQPRLGAEPRARPNTGIMEAQPRTRFLLGASEGKLAQDWTQGPPSVEALEWDVMVERIRTIAGLVLATAIILVILVRQALGKETPEPLNKLGTVAVGVILGMQAG